MGNPIQCLRPGRGADMGSLLTREQLLDTLDKAHRRAFEKRIDEQWRELQDRFKSLSERQPDYDERELENE